MKQRIIVIFVAISLVSMTTTALLSFYHSQQAAERQQLESFTRLAEALRDNVSRVIAKAQTDVTIVARNVETAAAFEKTLEFDLKRLGNILRDYSDITLIDEDGVVLASTTYDFHGDWHHRRGFLQALDSGHAMTGFHLLPATGKLCLAFYSRFSLPGGKSAVAAVQLDAERIAEIPLSIAKQQELVAFIVDENGRFVAHPQAVYLMEQAWPTLRYQLREPSGPVKFRMFDREFLGGYALFHALTPSNEAELPGWPIVVAMAHERVFGFLGDMLHWVNLAGAVIFAALVVLGLVLATRIVRPIERLVKAADQVAKRDFAVSVGLDGLPEVARLGTAFNAMVSELGEYQERLSRSEQRYRDLTDLLPQTVFEADDRGIFTYVNRAGLATFGYSEKDVELGQLTVLDMIVPEDRGRAAEIWRSLLAGAQLGGNRYRALRKDGSTTPILIYSAVYEIAPNKRGLRGIVIDVSELERKDSIIRQAQRLETIGLLAGGLAHDLNNVLGGILGAVGLIRHNLRPPRPNSDEVFRMLDIVDTSVVRAADMIQKLLAMSRRKDLSLVPVDLIRIVEHVAAVCRGSFDHSVELHTQTPSTPAIVMADVSQIEQVLLNLTINAYHAVTLMRGESYDNRGGHVCVSVHRQSVEDAADLTGLAPGLSGRSGDYWVVSVADDGVGISKESLSKIFEPFFTTKPAGRGSGLGLAVIHSIAQQNGGLLTVRSTVGKGTTFEFYLPVCEDALSPEGPISDEAPPKAEPGCVLVVDDDAVVLATTQTMLEVLGYEVDTASDGQAALDKVNASTTRYTLVLADLSMPGMSGSQLLACLKREFPGLRRALMTGNIDAHVTELIENLALEFVLAKPFDLDQLAAAVG